MRRRGVLQTMTDASEQTNTAPTLCVGGPVITLRSFFSRVVSDSSPSNNRIEQTHSHSIAVIFSFVTLLLLFLPGSKSRDTKTRTNINSDPIKCRYCALV